MDDPLWKDQKMYNSCLFALHLFHKRNKYHKYLGKKKGMVTVTCILV